MRKVSLLLVAATFGVVAPLAVLANGADRRHEADAEVEFVREHLMGLGPAELSSRTAWGARTTGLFACNIAHAWVQENLSNLPDELAEIREYDSLYWRHILDALPRERQQELFVAKLTERREKFAVEYTETQLEAIDWTIEHMAEIFAHVGDADWLERNQGNVAALLEAEPELRWATYRLSDDDLASDTCECHIGGGGQSPDCPPVVDGDACGSGQCNSTPIGCGSFGGIPLLSCDGMCQV